MVSGDAKKKSLAVQHNFLYISLPLLLQRETSKLHVLWRKCRMCSKKFCCLCSCSLFFTALHFYLTVRSQFLFSFRRYIMLFFQRNSSPFFSFFNLSSGSLSVFSSR